MTVSPRRRFSSNAFELGIFSFNVSGGLAHLKTDMWDASWDNNLEVARLAEEAGVEFLLPLGRWHNHRGYPIDTDADGGAFETLVWAGGILAATSKIAVFGTLHVAYVNPVFSAKQVVTAHHIGHGRFGLNVVSGTLQRDYEMFGIPYGDHDERYDYTEEWVSIVKRIWTESKPFDHDGKHFKLRNVLETPKPYGGQTPLLISAGASTRGRAFAVQQADSLFTAISNQETLEEELRVARAQATDGTRVPVYSSGHMVTRRTQKEADEWYHHLVYDLGYWEGNEEAATLRTRNRTIPYLDMQRLREAIISGGGTYCVRGSYDKVAQTFKELHDAGLDGMAVGLNDYIAEFPALRDEIIPRLVRLGLREK